MKVLGNDHILPSKKLANTFLYGIKPKEVSALLRINDHRTYENAKEEAEDQFQVLSEYYHTDKYLKKCESR